MAPWPRAPAAGLLLRGLAAQRRAGRCARARGRGPAAPPGRGAAALAAPAPAPAGAGSAPGPGPEELRPALEAWLGAVAGVDALAAALEAGRGVPAFFLQHERAAQQLELYLRSHPATLEDLGPVISSSPAQVIAAVGSGAGALETFLAPLLSVLCSFVEEAYTSQLATYRRVRDMADLQRPHSWFPAARQLRRCLRVHLGPTNSGKTHLASRRLLASSTGLYMSPLRLLAWEMYEKMRRAGLRCALRTGQESIGPLDATHIACTVEMAPLAWQVGVGVLDEIQLVTDGTRGAAWTRALLGVQARELHLCGAPEPPGLLELLQSLALDCNDEVSVETHQRMVPLLAERRPLGSLAEVVPGDCVVCFTRRDVLLTKAELEAQGHSPCVIYGSLPPEVRRQQAALFNDPASGHEVLVASDAIGLGLNLHIRRVVFASLRKFDGAAARQLAPAEIRQIAGRAGRYGSRYASCGLAAGLAEADHAAVRAALEGGGGAPEGGAPEGGAPAAALLPPPGALEAFGGALEAEAGRPLPFAEVLERLLAAARTSPRYFVAGAGGPLELARALAAVRLPPAEKLVFCQAPVAPRDAAAVAALHGFAQGYAARGAAALPEVLPPESPGTATPRQLLELERLHKVCDVYLWLAGRFPDAFPDAAAARAARLRLAERVGRALRAPLAAGGEGEAPGP